MRVEWNPFESVRRTAKSLGSVLLFMCAGSAHALGPGDAAPQFAAPALNGSSTVDLSEFRGKVVLLDFWASWCAPCLKSLPNLQALNDEFADSDFAVVAINVDKEPAEALQFLSKNAIRYPSVSDPEGKLPERFELSAMPTSYLIDRNGVIRYIHEGFERGDENTLRSRILSLLWKLQ